MSGDEALEREKREARRRILRERDLLPKEEREEESREIAERLLRLVEWERAREVYAYVSYGSEAGTLRLIGEALRAGKRVAVPKAAPGGAMEFYHISSLGELRAGFRGILEPDGDDMRRAWPSGEALFLVPGVGFDRKMRRLGYGGGYYDRYFGRLPVGAGRPRKAGLALRAQVRDFVPAGRGDMRMDFLLTPDGVISP